MPSAARSSRVTEAGPVGGTSFMLEQLQNARAFVTGRRSDSGADPTSVARRNRSWSRRRSSLTKRRSPGCARSCSAGASTSAASTCNAAVSMVTLAPGIGQEACSVGSVIPLDRTRDWFVPQYREAAGQLLHGLPLVQAFLWHMGSPLGFFIPPALRMLPFNAAVAGQIPHAAGLGWGLRLQRQRRCGRRSLRRRRDVAGRLPRGHQPRGRA